MGQFIDFEEKMIESIGSRENTLVFCIQSGLPSGEGWREISLKDLLVEKKEISKNKTRRDLRSRDHGFSMSEAEALARSLVGNCSGFRGPVIIWVEFHDLKTNRQVKKPLILQTISLNGKCQAFFSEISIVEEDIPQGTLVYFRREREK